MDLETENRIAAMLMKEAAELRRQAEKEGVHAYLREPNVRGRPNSRFLTATVLGVQQANRVVEVSEMWRIRQKEQELDDRLKGRQRDESSSDRSYRNSSDSRKGTRFSDSERKGSSSSSSSKRVIQDRYSTEDETLRDDEVEEFLNSRVKRGRGAVGSRMDETGPYLPPSPDSKGKKLASPDIGVREDWRRHVVLGPEKPSTLRCYESSENEPPQNRQKKAKKVSTIKQQSGKHRSKDKSKDKKRKRREEKRCKHHK